VIAAPVLFRIVIVYTTFVPLDPLFGFTTLVTTTLPAGGGVSVGVGVGVTVGVGVSVGGTGVTVG
jgi:hypothetical protein